MDEVLEVMPQIVTQNGGSVDWDTFKGAIPERLHRHIMPALRQLEQNQVIKRHIDGTVTPPTFRVITYPQG